MSMAYHPRTNGEAERVNQTLEQYLGTFCNFEEDNWSEMLPISEYVYNNSVTSVPAMTNSMPTMGIILEPTGRQKLKYEMAGHQIM
jgi:hypothetical protein